MATWIVTGSNRGIGLEIVPPASRARRCRVRGVPPDHEGARRDRLQGHRGRGRRGRRRRAEILDAIGDAKIDVLVNNAGVLVPDQLATLDFEAMKRQYDVNALGPLRVTRPLLSRLGKGSKIGFVSSRAGSIGDGPSGGLYGYRMSKTALNIAGVNLAGEVADRGIMVALLHPGFIRTEMTGGVGNDDPPVAARGLIARLDDLTPEKSGHFFHANGQELPW